jgi:mono/diheme cytochrome c family protein
VEAGAEPPEGVHPDAGAAANLPPGVTPPMIALGSRIFHGQVAGAACAGCHGSSGQGSPVGPNLTGKSWIWSDGSYDAIKKTITEGVPEPKQYRSAMPPMGGTQLTADQISAVAAYVWSLSHRASR